MKFPKDLWVLFTYTIVPIAVVIVAGLLLARCLR
jgi:hypothetical protein